MSSTVEQHLDIVAKQIMLAEVNDLPALARIREQFEQLTGMWKSVEAEALIHEAIARIDAIIFTGDGDANENMKELGRVISSLQALERSALPVVPEPPSSSTSGGSAIETAEVLSDNEITKAFLGRQDSVLEEMENCILGVEKHDPASLAALRRTLHTLKGEAGALGLTDVEILCHRTEDFLEAGAKGSSADSLLGVKDWLSQKFSAMSGKGEFPRPVESLLTVLEGAGKKPAGSAMVDSAHQNIPTDIKITADPGLVSDFVAEAGEHLHQADVVLLALERQSQDEEAINAVFRVFHTIKGVANFLNLKDIGTLAHTTESLLDKARKMEITLSGKKIDLIFLAVDAMKQEIAALSEATSTGNPYRCAPGLFALIESLRDSHAKEESPPRRIGEILVEKGAIEPCDLKEALHEQEQRPNEKIGQILVEKGATTNRDLTNALAEQKNVAHGVAIRETIKVDTERLDKLVDAVGELVIAEAMVTKDKELLSQLSHRTLKNMQQLDKITREIQEIGMSMRMVSIRSTFQKMARLVRDLAQKSGKEIRFASFGEDTELDKTVIEKIGDPLVHMVRNSADHGIESPQEREHAGKPHAGRLILRSFQKGGSVYIEVEDDGKGLDRDAILAKARAHRIVGETETPTDKEIYNLIFRPGFSTAHKVTDISGRGVGMDVVKRNIDGLRGNVEIFTEKGKGTRLSIRLPLTLAIIDGMVIQVGSERYIVPTLSVVETFRPSPNDVSTALAEGEMIMVHGRLLPLFRISGLFALENAVKDVCQGIVMIVEDSGRQIGLLIDHILGQQQTVIKSLSQGIGKVSGVSGGAIMSDGQISLILDIAGIVEMTRKKEAMPEDVAVAQ